MRSPEVTFDGVCGVGTDQSGHDPRGQHHHRNIKYVCPRSCPCPCPCQRPWPRACQKYDQYLAIESRLAFLPICLGEQVPRLCRRVRVQHNMLRSTLGPTLVALQLGASAAQLRKPTSFSGRRGHHILLSKYVVKLKSPESRQLVLIFLPRTTSGSQLHLSHLMSSHLISIFLIGKRDSDPMSRHKSGNWR